MLRLTLAALAVTTVGFAGDILAIAPSAAEPGIEATVLTGRTATDDILLAVQTEAADSANHAFRIVPMPDATLPPLPQRSRSAWVVIEESTIWLRFDTGSAIRVTVSETLGPNPWGASGHSEFPAASIVHATIAESAVISGGRLLTDNFGCAAPIDEGPCETCQSGGPGASSCSISCDGQADDCSVSCRAPGYACCCCKTFDGATCNCASQT